jgi:hypothetical protein
LALRWLDATGLRQYPLYRRVAPIEQFGNLMNRSAFAPALPHQCLLALGVIDPASLFHLQLADKYAAALNHMLKRSEN